MIPYPTYVLTVSKINPTRIKTLNASTVIPIRITSKTSIHWNDGRQRQSSPRRGVSKVARLSWRGFGCSGPSSYDRIQRCKLILSWWSNVDFFFQSTSHIPIKITSFVTLGPWNISESVAGRSNSSHPGFCGKCWEVPARGADRFLGWQTE